jgi:hypothetical protein
MLGDGENAPPPELSAVPAELAQALRTHGGGYDAVEVRIDHQDWTVVVAGRADPTEVWRELTALLAESS